MADHINIDEITVGAHFRKNLGDIDSLVASIEKVGLLQPIGVTPGKELIFGLRRIEAWKRLGRRRIPYKVIRVSDLLQAEQDENEVRKEFTVPERVAIADAIKAGLGERRGRPKKVPNKTLLSGTSADEAARKAGLGGRTSYELAKLVIQTAVPELREALDDDDMTISAASMVAKEPKKRQREIVKMPKDERRDAVREIRLRRAPSRESLHTKIDVLDAIEMLGTTKMTPVKLLDVIFEVEFTELPKHIDPAIAYLQNLKNEVEHGK